MPEGPELHLSSRFINRVCRGRIFDKICKSSVSKHADIDLSGLDGGFTISALSRGKEVKLTLSGADGQTDRKTDKKTLAEEQPKKTADIMFQFGMSGKFDFAKADELQKHAHLNFYTRDDESKMVLSFVDYRRFGKWKQGNNWSSERGPCVLQEYPKFRENVLRNLKGTAFNKPICEVLLNQKYFNGIGNYLRAEILYRAGIPPFVCARSVLEPLIPTGAHTVKSEQPDILELCHLLPQEVINLEGSGYDPEDRKSYTTFSEWLQCYYQDEMENITDHNGRTMWFSGSVGPMVPKEGRSRGKKKHTKSKSVSDKVVKPVKEEEVVTVKQLKPKAKARRKSTKGKRNKTVESGVKESNTVLSISDLKLSLAIGTARLTRGAVQRIKETHTGISETGSDISPTVPKRRKSAGKGTKGDKSSRTVVKVKEESQSTQCKTNVRAETGDIKQSAAGISSGSGLDCLSDNNSIPSDRKRKLKVTKRTSIKSLKKA